MNITIEKWQKWQIISIEGAFIVRVLSDIRTVFDSVETDEVPLVALDFGRVTYIDSSAITLILNFQKRLNALKGDLIIFGPGEDIQGIFSIANIGESVQIFRSRAEFEATSQNL